MDKIYANAETRKLIQMKRIYQLRQSSDHHTVLFFSLFPSSEFDKKAKLVFVYNA